MLELPTQEHLQSLLVIERDTIRAEGATDVDIRLVAGYEGSSHEGEWALMTGDVSYDQWHGYCAADALSTDLSRAGCYVLAGWLLEEIRNQMAGEDIY